MLNPTCDAFLGRIRQLPKFEYLPEITRLAERHGATRAFVQSGIDGKILNQDDACRSRADPMNVAYFAPFASAMTDEAIEKIPREVAKKVKAISRCGLNGVLTVAMASPVEADRSAMTSKKTRLTLEQMMISQTIIPPFQPLIQTPNGIIFVTGPMGSGRDSRRRNPRSGDGQNATEAALTGHIVFAPLHPHTAPEAIMRLIEIGVAPSTVAPSVIDVLAQRLAARICEGCQAAYAPSRETLRKYFKDEGLTEVSFYRGGGCQTCRYTGYQGRVAFHELVLITEEIRTLIAEGRSVQDISRAAAQVGHRPLRHDGLKKVLFGLTTIEEIDQNTSFEWATGCLVRGPNPSARVHPPPHRRVARSSFTRKLHPILEPMTESRAIDPQAIEILRSLNPDDHDEFLREIAGIFMEDTPRRIAELEQSLAAADLPKFTRAAHSIKGSSANLGAMALGAVAERLEQHARTNGVNAAAPFVAELTAEFARARAELTKLIKP